MLKFALKNMAIKKVQCILIVLSIVISAGVAVLSYNVANQISDGITGTAGYYSAIIGPSGSATQLAMNTMYFTDEPLGTIPYSVVSNLSRDTRVRTVIPFAMADSYNGFSVVGTSSAFLETKELSSGTLFDDSASLQVVLGYSVAKVNRLSVGDSIYTSHAVGEEHKTPITVVGILKQTHTVYDNVLFTEIRTIWDIHEHEEEEHEEEHDHGEMHNMVCAVLVKAKTPTDSMLLVNDYDGKIVSQEDENYTLQAIEPMAVVRGILDDTNTTKYVVYALCAIILAMNIVIITVITLLNMVHSKDEISLMRLIGISMKKINLLYIIENGITGLVSVLLAFGLSRLCLSLMGDYVASMGVVLNVGKIYPPEIIILAGVWLISVLPTFICTFRMARKDGI